VRVVPEEQEDVAPAFVLLRYPLDRSFHLARGPAIGKSREFGLHLAGVQVDVDGVELHVVVQHLRVARHRPGMDPQARQFGHHGLCLGEQPGQLDLLVPPQHRGQPHR